MDVLWVLVISAFWSTPGGVTGVQEFRPFESHAACELDLVAHRDALRTRYRMATIEVSCKPVVTHQSS